MVGIQFSACLHRAGRRLPSHTFSDWLLAGYWSPLFFFSCTRFNVSFILLSRSSAYCRRSSFSACQYFHLLNSQTAKITQPITDTTKPFFAEDMASWTAHRTIAFLSATQQESANSLTLMSLHTVHATPMATGVITENQPQNQSRFMVCQVLSPWPSSCWS